MKEFAFVGTFEEGADDGEETSTGGGAGSDGPTQIDDDSLLGAVMPKAVAKVAVAPPPPAEDEDESEHEAEDHEPIPAPAPVKTTVVKKIVKKVVKA